MNRREASVAPADAVARNGSTPTEVPLPNLSRAFARVFVKSFVAHQLCSNRVRASFYLPQKQAVLALMFQRGIALPSAFLLERRMAWGPMRAFPFILMHMTACYWVSAALVYRAARRLTNR